MSGNKVIKSVSLNKTVTEDQLILDRIKRRNFSGYVKKLILADIAKGKEVKAQNKPIEAVKNDVPTKEETAAEKMARMQEELKKRTN